RQLGAPEAPLRDAAEAALARAGAAARPLLRAALTDPDPEIVRRARRALAAGDQLTPTPVLAAALRRWASAAPPDAAAALLGLPPGRDEPWLARQARAAVSDLVRRAGRADAAVRAALADADPVRRSAAAAVGPLSDADRAPVRALLADPVPTVRL